MPRIILVVEDDRSLRETLAENFIYDGHVVHEAAHGGEAMKLLGEGCRPGIILLDIVMPVVDGIRFLELKNAEPMLARIPVIVMSATENRSLEGTAQLLIKPVSPVELASAIDRHYDATVEAHARATR